MEALGSAVGGGVRASESERVRSRKRGLVLVVLAVGGIFFRDRERERGWDGGVLVVIDTILWSFGWVCRQI
jgi:hypothetical protein